MRKKLQQQLLELYKGKIKPNKKASIFLLCLLLSTFFWFLSSLSKEYTTVLSVPLSYSDYSEDFLLSRPPRESIQIEVSSSGFELLGEQMSLDRSAVLVDLNLARRTGKNRYGLATSNLRSAVLETLDKDIRLLRIVSDSIYFETQERISKKVKVVPTVNASYKLGYAQNGALKVEPAYVSISGPKSYLDTLQELSTPVITLQNVDDSLYENVQLLLPSIEGVHIEPSEVRVLVPVEKFTEKVLKQAVIVRFLEDTYNLITFPNQVEAIFSVPLNKYENLNENMIEAIVEFDKNSLGRKKLRVKVEGIPSYAKLIRIEPDAVEFIVKK